MSEPIQGRAWVLGNDVDTGQIAPGHAMRKPIEQLAAYCLESVIKGFAANVQRGDIVVGGTGFGIGSAREQAPQALRFLGVSVIIAQSAGRIFYRNAFNLGLPVLICRAAGSIAQGDVLRVELATGRIENVTQRATYQGEEIPGFLLEMIEAGGLIPHLHARLKRERERAGQ